MYSAVKELNHNLTVAVLATGGIFSDGNIKTKTLKSWEKKTPKLSNPVAEALKLSPKNLRKRNSSTWSQMVARLDASDSEELYEINDDTDEDEGDILSVK